MGLSGTAACCGSSEWSSGGLSVYSDIPILCLILPFRRKCRHRSGTVREKNRMTGRMIHKGTREKVYADAQE